MHIREKLRSVLIIDDDQHALSISSVVLSSMANLHVYTCRSGAEALAIVGDIKPDLLLLKLSPDLAGVTTLTKIRNLPGLIATRAIFLVSGDLGSALDHEELGAIGLIRKPFELMLLSEQVLQLWERQVLTAE